MNVREGDLLKFTGSIGDKILIDPGIRQVIEVGLDHMRFGTPEGDERILWLEGFTVYDEGTKLVLKKKNMTLNLERIF